jgi:hypothetical protein
MTMMKYGFSEEVSEGSEPHIFVDGSASSISDTSSFYVDATKPATPHIFLAYAKRSCAVDLRTQLQHGVSRRERNGRSDLAVDVKPESVKRRDSMLTAHPFLSYVGNSPTDQQEEDECVETQAGEDTCETTERKVLLDWGESLDSFQSRCRDYMTTEHHIPHDRAGNVASAMAAAATRVVPGKNLSFKHRNMQFASIIDQILNESKTNVSRAETVENAKNDGESMQQTKENLPTEAMLRTFERQEAELSFLRLALKHLILPPKTDFFGHDKIKPPPCIAYNLQVSSPLHQVIGYHSSRHADADEKPARRGIPSYIELREHRDGPHVVEMETDQLEVASQLTPSIGDFDSPLELEQHNLLLSADGLTLYADLSKVQDAAPWHLQIPSLVPAPTVAQPLQSAPRSRTGRKSPVNRTCCLSLPHETRDDGQPQQSLGRESSITDMEKGEIRGQRARSVEFSIQLNDAKVLLKGKYSGKIRTDTGLPHGQGVFRFENRDLYVGEFEDGMFHGSGTLLTRRNRNLIKLRGNFHHNCFVGDNLLLQQDAMSDGLSV